MPRHAVRPQELEDTCGVRLAFAENEFGPGATGTLSMNATDLTSPRALEFVLDAGEAANSTDDDGDGLVDEGKLFLRYESTRTPIADGVESCSFEVDGRVIRFSVQCAKRDGSGRVHRETTQQVWWVRNE